MREIKIRMWNGTSKRYHYDVENVLQCLAQQNVHDSIMPTRGFTVAYDHIAEGCVFELCSGKKDKNGVDVYEGDITPNGVVEFSFGCFCINGDRPITAFKDLEVIGNIHEKGETK